MPVHEGKDSSGPYFQWGTHGKKYYYKPKSAKSKEDARQKAATQGRAIKASQFRAMHAGFLSQDNNFYHQQYLKYKGLYLKLSQ